MQSNLIFSTYLGGGRDEGIRGLAVDRAGNFGVAGWTSSGNFRARNAFQPKYGGGECRFYSYDPCGDAFVAKINPNASRVEYATFLGGPGSDFATGMASDAASNTYVAGYASEGFPVRGPSLAGQGLDAFVAKLGPDGSVVYSIMLGGPGVDGANGIAIDRAGNVFIAGTAMGGFPTTRGAPPQDGEPGRGAFVAKLDATGGLLYSTFIGGKAQVANGVAVDRAGNAYVAGSGNEGPPRLRATKPPQPSPSDAFAAKLDPSGTVVYTRWLAGPRDDDANAIALDRGGNAYIAGSAGRGFPTRQAIEERNAGRSDAFLAKLDEKGSVLYSTLLGGPKKDAAHAVIVSPEGSVYLAGEARDGFPARGALQSATRGHTDAFLARFGEEGTRPTLRYSTFLGGSGREFARAVATRAADLVLIGGHTDSRSDFPTLSGVQPSGLGQVESFLTAVSSTSRPLPIVSEVLPRSGPVRGGTRVTISGKNLAEVRSVRFGDRRATEIRVSEDGRKLWVRTPRARPGRIDVILDAPQGASLPTAGSHFEYAKGLWTPLQASLRYHHGATLLHDGRVLVAGGCIRLTSARTCDPKSDSPSPETFDPKTGRWAAAGRLQGGQLTEPAIVTLPQGPRSQCGRNCGKVLMVALARNRITAQLFDPVTGIWTRTAQPSPAERGGYTLTSIPAGPSSLCGDDCGKVLLIKHGGGGAGLALGQLFDPRRSSWAPAVARPEPHNPNPTESTSELLRRLAPVTRTYHTATLLGDGRVLLVGGFAAFGAAIAPSEVYDPEANALVPIPAPAVTRYVGHSGTSLRDGTVLIAGGMTDNLGTLTFSSEIFDPTEVADRPGSDMRGAFRPAPSLNRGRYGHTATLLKDGSVLITGGADSTGVPIQRGPGAEVGNGLSGAELFQPETGRWTSAGSMSEGRGPSVVIEGFSTYTKPTFTATRLPDGRVLVVGARMAEIYSPSGIGPSFGLRARQPDRSRAWSAVAAGGALAILTVSALLLRRRRVDG